jgi:hypothetical protein
MLIVCLVDMNGIVHPCTHPEGRPAPETEEEMMVEVFKYTERVVNMARPRKVLMMAIGEFGLSDERQRQAIRLLDETHYTDIT